MKPPALEIIVFVTGVTAATVAGVAAYRWYGMYGVGPAGSGFSREWDSSLKTYRLVHESVISRGVLRRIFNVDGELIQVELDRDGDGNPEESVKYAGGQAVAIGFSRANNGVIDAWVYRDEEGRPLRIEMSTRERNRIDRWEIYSHGVLVRVDLDTDGNGERDRWETYEAGRFTGTVIDANEDGKPDTR